MHRHTYIVVLNISVSVPFFLFFTWLVSTDSTFNQYATSPESHNTTGSFMHKERQCLWEHNLFVWQHNLTLHLFSSIILTDVGKINAVVMTAHGNLSNLLSGNVY